jgi:hypothetical protein
MIRSGVENYVIDIALNIVAILLLVVHNGTDIATNRVYRTTFLTSWQGLLDNPVVSAAEDREKSRGRNTLYRQRQTERPIRLSRAETKPYSRPLLSCVTDSLALITQGIFQILRKPL